MYRKRLRNLSQDEKNELYTKKYDHSQWDDHIYRVQRTISIANSFLQDLKCHPYIVGDLSCGDGAIVNGLENVKTAYLGDLTPGYQFEGPIEETIKEIPPVDLFVCTETIEHVEQPEKLLRQIKKKAKYLLLSTPNCEYVDDNPEHLWAWNHFAVRYMLEVSARWIPVECQRFKADVGYEYQVWTATAR